MYHCHVSVVERNDRLIAQALQEKEAEVAQRAEQADFQKLQVTANWHFNAGTKPTCIGVEFKLQVLKKVHLKPIFKSIFFLEHFITF